MPGPVEFVSNGTTSVTPSTLTANISALTSGAVDNRPGLQLRWKFYYVSGSSSSSAAIRLDEINVTSTAINNNYIATGQVTNAIFCLTPTVGVSVSIPFNYGPLSVFSAGITFSAQLSDASGSFASPVILGTVISDGSGNQTVPHILTGQYCFWYRLPRTHNQFLPGSHRYQQFFRHHH